VSASFAGKTIVITGASDGIGAELARQMAAPGAKLALAARNAEKLERVAAQVRERGATAIAVPTDVGVEADCARLVERAAAELGGIDVLVNNAGVSGHALFEEVIDFGWYEDMMRVNFFGSLWCTRYALPHLRRAKGLVVGVSSLVGKQGVPGRTAYAASKFAMTGFFEALRIELAGTGVDVTMVYPGIVATDLRIVGYGADGKPRGKSGLDEKGAMPVEECARIIVDAAMKRKREVVMTAKAKVGLWIKMIAPGVVDNMARNALTEAEKAKLLARKP
jgi:short-subunit dehydrogenase